ncbi:MAG TPA: HAD-IIIA family hydrolase [Mycobacteriales bacterium]|nr:HAD-IIIA family hydrolase [Mycobacteriales bacterium]
MNADRPPFAVVIPTVGRPSLAVLLESLANQSPAPAEVVVADDRRQPRVPLDLAALPGTRVVATGGRGPAAARNSGWLLTDASWVVTVDDDVVLPEGWSVRLVEDLRVAPDVGAVAGRITVPLPAGRAPTDAERDTAALENAWMATADMAVRRSALADVGGFDERFPRAYREDADLAARLRLAGWRLAVGRREVIHPPRRSGRWVSVRAQRGNADDMLMRAVHGPAWRAAAGCPRGRFGWHALTVGTGLTALLAAGIRRHRTAGIAALGWVGLTAEFARRRIAPGPGGRAEVTTMLATSAAIPPVAVWWRAVGAVRHRGAGPWPGRPRAVLFDRDGTLVDDVPFNGDPKRLSPMDGAGEAVGRLRAAGMRIGLVTNQSGVGRGLITEAEVGTVNARLAGMLGPFDTVRICPHRPEEGCRCRKPAAGLIRAAARDLRVAPHQTVVIGDIGADVHAARAAGARSVLVPTAATRAEEVAAAPVVAGTLREAVDRVLGRWPG